MRALAAVLGLAASGQAPPPTPQVAVPPMIALPARPTMAPAMACEALMGRDFAGIREAPTELLGAEVVAATAGSPAMCRVTGYVAPQVQFELRLPMTGYTGRYLQIGCGGNCGFIRLEASPRCDTAMAQSGAFAIAATNTGHVGNALWARDNPALQRDFAERGVHVVAIAAKAIVTSFYGAAPHHSYFEGCSDGGREAMVEAQRHPAAFDGLVAGAPANNITTGFLRFAWQEVKNRNVGGHPILTRSAGERLHAAVMAQCDALDGLRDGQIDEPRRCALDPASLTCTDPAIEQPGRCLSAAQAATARAFYGGPVDAAGRHLSIGGLSYGSELTWAGTSRRPIVEAYFRHLIYGSRKPLDYGLRDIRFDVDTMREVMTLGAHYDARDPDLTAFRDAGGRMIVWEGAADPSAGPNATLAYYQDVRDALGGTEAARRTVRLFGLPGVYHCGSGTMPYQANFLGAIVRWVEQGEAPDHVIAAAALPTGGVRTRPIYAYPVAARYRGRGSIDAAESFGPARPASDPDDHYAWAGADRPVRERVR